MVSHAAQTSTRPIERLEKPSETIRNHQNGVQKEFVAWLRTALQHRLLSAADVWQEARGRQDLGERKGSRSPGAAPAAATAASTSTSWFRESAEPLCCFRGQQHIFRLAQPKHNHTADLIQSSTRLLTRSCRQHQSRCAVAVKCWSRWAGVPNMPGGDGRCNDQSLLAWLTFLFLNWRTHKYPS